MGLVYHYIYKVCHGARCTIESQLILAVLRSSWKKKDVMRKFKTVYEVEGKLLDCFQTRPCEMKCFYFE